MIIEQVFHIMWLVMALAVLVLVYVMINYKIGPDRDIDMTMVLFCMGLCALSGGMVVCYLHVEGMLWWM